MKQKSVRFSSRGRIQKFLTGGEVDNVTDIMYEFIGKPTLYYFDINQMNTILRFYVVLLLYETAFNNVINNLNQTQANKDLQNTAILQNLHQNLQKHVLELNQKIDTVKQPIMYSQPQPFDSMYSQPQPMESQEYAEVVKLTDEEKKFFQVVPLIKTKLHQTPKLENKLRELENKYKDQLN
jgi:hypothetical protein